MQKTSRRVLALVLSLIMALSVFTVAASAYDGTYVSETHDVFKHYTQTLAPGVEYYNNYAYLKDGEQVVYYVATADINRDDVIVQGSYWNMQTEQYGMAKLTEQVASANAKFSDPDDPDFISENYTVVAGTNGDFYNMQTGRPSGAFAINGHVMNESNNRPWFAIFEDGTALCGSGSADYAAAIEAHGAVQNSVGGSQMLVQNGEDVTASASGSYNTDRHSRTMIGVTADNKVVSCVVDGRQSPFSAGGSMHELAQIMLEAECVTAINLDGGGSTTFGARPEGEDSFRVINRPSDGSERSISSGVVIASLAAPSNVFDHVSIKVADDYITPGTSTTFTVDGVSTSGASAEIPEEVTYVAINGSIDGNVVTAGDEGEVEIRAMRGDDVVGYAIFNAVIPDSIEFAQATFTVPYGKSMDLGIIAKYGLNEVKTKPADFEYTLEIPEDAGQIVDGVMVAPAEGAEAAANAVTATLVADETKTATANIAFGKASQVLFDFEDGTTQKWVRYNTSNYNYIHTRGTTSNVTAENGQVHSGKHALKINAKFSETWEAGYISGRAGVYGMDEIIDLKGATRLGMWMYIPTANASFNGRIFLCKVTERDEETGAVTKYDGYYTATQIDNGGNWNCGFTTQYDEPGWHYVYFDLSTDTDWCIIKNATLLDFYINDRNGDSFGYNHLNHTNGNADMNLYIDDVTVDYSSVVEDREAPVFSSVLLGDDGPHSNEGLVLERGSNYESDGYGRLDLSARVADNTAKTNYTGLNADSAKVYLDGVEFPCTYVNGIITAPTYTFTNGQHTVKFAISDNAGNYASAIRTFTVKNTDKDQSVWIEAKDPDADKILLGSLYWVNVKAADAANVASVDVDLDLDNLSNWELDHMEIAQGFDASYKIINADENIAKLTITRNSDAIALLDGDAIVSMPIRTWELPAVAANYGHAGVVWMYPNYKSGNEVWPVNVIVNVAAGQATFSDDSTEIFTGDEVNVRTESIYWDNDNAKASDDYYKNWNGGHDHRPETAQYYSDTATNHVDARVSKEAKAPTCTEDGWTEELYCDVCNSVVKWSEPIPATGHDFALDLDQHAIVCKTCGAVDTSFTGVFENNGKYYYAKFGVLDSGWIMVDDDYYYFDKETFEGKDGVVSNHDVMNSSNTFTYTFENGKLVHGEWVKLADGTRYYYGPNYYAGIFATIDGNTYYFDKKGYYLTGYQLLTTGSNSHQKKWHLFDENGIDQVPLNGLHQIEGDLYYLEDGWPIHKGLIKEGDDYYYIRSNGIAAVDCACYAYVTNCDLPADQTYEFGADGKMIIPEPDPVKNGIVDGYYYENDELVYAGLIKIDGDYYYVRSTGIVATNGTYYAYKTSCDLSANREYKFDENGKMIDPPAPYEGVKNGIVDGYYYENDEIVYAGLIKLDGDYYYIRSAGNVAKNGSYYAYKTSCDLPADTRYEFDADGKMINPYTYYLVGSMNNWTNMQNEYKFVKNTASDANEYMLLGVKIAAETELKVQANNNAWYPDNAANLTIHDAGIYDIYFRPDYSGDSAWYNGCIYASRVGDIPAVKNGIVDGYYYENDQIVYAGLIKLNDDYYYVRSSGIVATNGTYFAYKTSCDLPADREYKFDEDGKMINPPTPYVGVKNGIVDGYYYENDQIVYKGLTKIGEDYYYIRTTGIVAKNGKFYAYKTSCDLPADTTYTFDADGKMIR